MANIIRTIWIFAVCLTLWLTPIESRRHRPRNPRHNNRCSEPDDLYQRLANRVASMQFHSSYFNVKHYQQVFSGNHMHIRRSGPHMTCPVVTPAQDSDAVSVKSICPWSYSCNYDDNRYPRYMMEARCRPCLTNLCSGVNDCEPLHHNVPVLYRTNQCDRQGYYQYELAWYKLSVGCMCARRKISS